MTIGLPTPTASAPVLDDRPLDEQLLEAVRDGDAARVELALAEGADPDAAAGDANDNTALSLAITRDDAAMVEVLVGAGAAFEYPELGFSELSTAAEYASDDVTATLLEAGADPNGLPPLEGMPLAQAAYAGNVSVMAMLLGEGADPNAVVAFEEGTGYTPLLSAAYGGSREAADLLLQWGADPAWEDADGATAGGWAAAQGHRELGEYLDSLIAPQE